MRIDGMTFPNESAAYRQARNELLAEAQLRDQVEAVAALQRQLPLGGLVGDYGLKTLDLNNSVGNFSGIRR